MKAISRTIVSAVVLCLIAAMQTITTATTSLPSSVDNSKFKYLRPVYNHLGHACGFASGIGYAFTYEMAAIRDLDAHDSANQYSYLYPYHFYNDGLDSMWTDDYTLAFDIIKANGIPNCVDQGGFESGFPTKWVTGYDKYYRGMHNRMIDYFPIKLTTVEGLQKAKQWLYNHGNGSSQGGLLLFSIYCLGIQEGILSLGTPFGNSKIVTQFGMGHPHSMTIVGYNDSVRFDINRDKKYTNDVDINEDNKVDMQDWEIGAFKILNSWGPSYGDSGFIFAPYRLFATPVDNYGVGRDNQVFGMHVTKDFIPKLTIKATITNTARNDLKIYAGVSDKIDAVAPDKKKSFGGLFNFAGGAFPMEGKNRSSTLEIGLDITDLWDSIGGKPGKFFLIVESKAVGGTVDSMSVLEYSSTSKEPIRVLNLDQKAVAIVPNSTLNLGVVSTLPQSIKKRSQLINNTCFSISPNPVTSSGTVQFAIQPQHESSATLSIMTPAGKVIARKTWNKGAKDYLQWNLKNSSTPLSCGVYITRITVRNYKTGVKEFSGLMFVK